MFIKEQKKITEKLYLIVFMRNQIIIDKKGELSFCLINFKKNVYSNVFLQHKMRRT